MNTTHTKIDQLGDKVALIFLTGSPLLLAIKNNKEAQQQLSEGLIAFKSAVLEKRNKEVMDILSKANYEQEEWYASSERPDTLTHFEANQINMKTRNKIQDLLTDITK